MSRMWLTEGDGVTVALRVSRLAMIAVMVVLDILVWT